MIKLAFVFRTAPYGSSASREGLDALLAATAFCDEDEIAVFFIEDGIFNLLIDQQPESILQRDIANPLKLLELYDIEQCYICQNSANERHFSQKDSVISCEMLNRAEIIEKLQQAEKILTF